MGSELLRLELLDDEKTTTNMSYSLPNEPRDPVGSDSISIPFDVAGFVVFGLESILKLDDIRDRMKRDSIQTSHLVRLTSFRVHAEKPKREGRETEECRCC